MKSVFYNPTKAEQESKEKSLAELEQTKRQDYFQRLSKDRRFQKYIMEEIIETEIKLNTDLSGSLEKLLIATPEQVKDIILAKSSGKKTAENIKNKIVMNY